MGVRHFCQFKAPTNKRSGGILVILYISLLAAVNSQSTNHLVPRHLLEYSIPEPRTATVPRTEPFFEPRTEPSKPRTEPFSTATVPGMTHVILLFIQPPPAQYRGNKSLASSRRHVAASYWTAASDMAPTLAPVNDVGPPVNVGRPPVNVANHRHVAASYWTAASDVAATSAPINGGHRRSTTVNAAGHGQRRRVTVVIGGQRWRSTTVNATDHRSTVAVNDGHRWRTTVDCRWTTVNGGWWAGQRAGLGRSGSGLGQVRVGFGPGPPRGMPRASHVCTLVSHVCPCGIHVAADVDNKHTWESNSAPFEGKRKGGDDVGKVIGRSGGIPDGGVLDDSKWEVDSVSALNGSW
nr:hypothetical protein [Tanacetum cinerariifolium]